MVNACVLLTINNLAVLEVLFEELDTSIDAVLDLVICVYLDGYIVPERD
jgi:hypothetical protein